MPVRQFTPSRTAVILALRTAGCVFAEEEADLILAAASTPADLSAMVDQRVAGRPLEHILGWAEFFGVRILVDDGVFVPRRRTELIVQEALALAIDPAVIVDLCCGSGAVGTALATALDDVDLYASDIDPAAVACARLNLEPLGGHVFAGDLYAPLPGILAGRVNILAVNAPYVPTDAIAMMPPEARFHEPIVALDGGEDGLDVQRRVARDAGRWLTGGGHLLIETSLLQAPRTAALLTDSGLQCRVVHSDELDATVVVGTRPAR